MLYISLFYVQLFIYYGNGLTLYGINSVFIFRNQQTIQSAACFLNKARLIEVLQYFYYY
jgi:hypothetical protein